MLAPDRPAASRRGASIALAAYYVVAAAIPVAAIATGGDDDPPLAWAFDLGTILTWGVLGAIGLWRRGENAAVRRFAAAGVTVAATVWVAYLEPLIVPDSRAVAVQAIWRLLNIIVYFGTFPLLVDLGASVPRRNPWVRRYPWLLRANYALAATLVTVLAAIFALPLRPTQPLRERLGP
jgi:hypothetical protein